MIGIFVGCWVRVSVHLEHINLIHTAMRNTRIIFSAMVMLLVSLNAYCQEYVAMEYEGLKYRQLSSCVDDSTKLALIIYLHGRSGSGSDNKAQLANVAVRNIEKYIKKNNVSAYFLIPQCPIEYEWSPRADMPGCIEKVSSLITHFISTHNIDTSRIYICGTSMGAVGCWEIIKSNQGLFAAALIASGVSPRTQPDSFLNIPIYATCGSEERSYEILPSLTSKINKGGGNANLDVLQGLRHREACDSAFTPKRIQWLFSQELKR